MDEKSTVKRIVRQESSGLEGMAQHIKSSATWKDLAFPQNLVTKLMGFCHQLKQSGVTSQKSTLGKGQMVLFTGACGTNKTKAAEVIANELCLDLYRIDLSAVVSKHIGETEKNLSRVFGAAEAAHVILFFDEADSLFSRRTEVKDAHDRFANDETSNLLQPIDDYAGLAILATNSRQALDEAFTRRFSDIVEFPLSNTEERESLWKDVLPAESPASSEPPLKSRLPREK